MNRNRWRVLREMVERWNQTTAQVERGYLHTFDDYLNDLDLRRQIDERIGQSDDTLNGVIPESIRIALAAADERFRQATTASDENVWGVENERESGWSAEREWYYYRRPTGLS